VRARRPVDFDGDLAAAVRLVDRVLRAVLDLRAVLERCAGVVLVWV
jgi:hypothetical protein